MDDYLTPLAERKINEALEYIANVRERTKDVEILLDRALNAETASERCMLLIDAEIRLDKIVGMAQPSEDCRQAYRAIAEGESNLR